MPIDVGIIRNELIEKYSSFSICRFLYWKLRFAASVENIGNIQRPPITLLRIVLPIPTVESGDYGLSNRQEDQQSDAAMIAGFADRDG